MAKVEAKMEGAGNALAAVRRLLEGLEAGRAAAGDLEAVLQGLRRKARNVGSGKDKPIALYAEAAATPAATSTPVGGSAAPGRLGSPSDAATSGPLAVEEAAEERKEDRRKGPEMEENDTESAEAVRQACVAGGLLDKVSSAVGHACELPLGRVATLLEVCRLVVAQSAGHAQADAVPLLRVAALDFLQAPLKPRGGHLEDSVADGRRIVDELQGILATLPAHLSAACPSLSTAERAALQVHLGARFLSMERRALQIQGAREIADAVTAAESARCSTTATARVTDTGVICIDDDDDETPGSPRAEPNAVSAAVLSALQDREIFPTFLGGPEAASELLECLLPVFRFFARRGGLSDKMLRLLWRWLLSLRASSLPFRIGLLRLLAEMSGTLSASQCAQLRHDITEMPLENLDGPLLMLMLHLEAADAARGPDGVPEGAGIGLSGGKGGARLSHFACFGRWHHSDAALEGASRHAAAREAKRLLDPLFQGWFKPSEGGLPSPTSATFDAYRSRLLVELQSCVTDMEAMEAGDARSLPLRPFLAAWHLIGMAVAAKGSKEVLAAWWRGAPGLLARLNPASAQATGEEDLAAWLAVWWAIPVSGPAPSECQTAAAGIVSSLFDLGEASPTTGPLVCNAFAGLVGLQLALGTSDTSPLDESAAEALSAAVVAQAAISFQRQEKCAFRSGGAGGEALAGALALAWLQRAMADAAPDPSLLWGVLERSDAPIGIACATRILLRRDQEGFAKALWQRLSCGPAGRKGLLLAVESHASLQCLDETGSVREQMASRQLEVTLHLVGSGFGLGFGFATSDAKAILFDEFATVADLRRTTADALGDGPLHQGREARLRFASGGAPLQDEAGFLHDFLPGAEAAVEVTLAPLGNAAQRNSTPMSSAVGVDLAKILLRVEDAVTDGLEDLPASPGAGDASSGDLVQAALAYSDGMNLSDAEHFRLLQALARLPVSQSRHARVQRALAGGKGSRALAGSDRLSLCYDLRLLLVQLSRRCPRRHGPASPKIADLAMAEDDVEDEIGLQDAPPCKFDLDAVCELLSQEGNRLAGPFGRELLRSLLESVPMVQALSPSASPTSTAAVLSAALSVFGLGGTAAAAEPAASLDAAGASIRSVLTGQGCPTPLPVLSLRLAKAAWNAMASLAKSSPRATAFMLLSPAASRLFLQLLHGRQACCAELLVGGLEAISTAAAKAIAKLDAEEDRALPVTLDMLRTALLLSGPARPELDAALAAVVADPQAACFAARLPPGGDAFGAQALVLVCRRAAQTIRETPRSRRLASDLDAARGLLRRQDLGASPPGLAQVLSELWTAAVNLPGSWRRPTSLTSNVCDKLLGLFEQADDRLRPAPNPEEPGLWDALRSLMEAIPFPPGAREVATTSSATQNLFARRPGPRGGWGLRPSLPWNGGWTPPLRVGLANGGCTCYSNAILQQLYHVPGLPEAIWAAQAKLADADGSTPDSSIRALGRLFLRLRFGLEASAPTSAFLKSLGKAFGSPIDPGEQQDAEEFAARLLDVLEFQGKETGVPSFIKEELGGSFAQSVTCGACGKVSRRHEDFFFVSLTVDETPHLAAALDALTRPEPLTADNQYFCDACGRKQDSSRQTLLHRTPRTLLIHLKRFSYDVLRQCRSKIHDRFEFPIDLDLGPYLVTSDSTGPPYVLVGVVVHRGTAESGHYFSYIRERGTQDWIQCNDTFVSEAELASFLEVDGFGRRDGRTASAYVLVYERACDAAAPPEADEAKVEVTPAAVAAADPICGDVLRESELVHTEVFLFRPEMAMMLAKRLAAQRRHPGPDLRCAATVSLRYALTAAAHPGMSVDEEPRTPQTAMDGAVRHLFRELGAAVQESTDLAGLVFQLVTNPDAPLGFHAAAQEGFRSVWATLLRRLTEVCLPQLPAASSPRNGAPPAAKKPRRSALDPFLETLWELIGDLDTALCTRRVLLRMMQGLLQRGCLSVDDLLHRGARRLALLGLGGHVPAALEEELLSEDDGFLHPRALSRLASPKPGETGAALDAVICLGELFREALPRFPEALLHREVFGGIVAQAEALLHMPCAASDDPLQGATVFRTLFELLLDAYAAQNGAIAAVVRTTMHAAFFGDFRLAGTSAGPFWNPNFPKSSGLRRLGPALAGKFLHSCEGGRYLAPVLHDFAVLLEEVDSSDDAVGPAVADRVRSATTGFRQLASGAVRDASLRAALWAWGCQDRGGRSSFSRLMSTGFLQHRLPQRSEGLAKDTSLSFRHLVHVAPASPTLAPAASTRKPQPEPVAWWQRMNPWCTSKVRELIAQEVARRCATEADLGGSLSFDADAVDVQARIDPPTCEKLLQELLRTVLGVEEAGGVVDVEAEASPWSRFLPEVEAAEGKREEWQHLAVGVRLAQLLVDECGGAGDQHSSSIFPLLRGSLCNVFLLLEHLNGAKRNHDRSRGELYAFLCLAFSRFPSLQTSLFGHQRLQEARRDLCWHHFYFIRTCEKNVEFCERYLPVYFACLHYLSVDDDSVAPTDMFTTHFHFHENLQWAVSSYGTASDLYPRVTTVLLALLNETAHEPLRAINNGAARHEFWKQMVQRNGFRTTILPASGIPKASALLRTLQFWRLAVETLGFDVHKAGDSDNIPLRLLRWATQIAAGTQGSPSSLGMRAAMDSTEAECETMLSMEWDEGGEEELADIFTTLRAQMRVQKVFESLRIARALLEAAQVPQKLNHLLVSRAFDCPKYVITAVQEMAAPRPAVAPDPLSSAVQYGSKTLLEWDAVTMLAATLARGAAQLLDVFAAHDHHPPNGDAMLLDEVEGDNGAADGALKAKPAGHHKSVRVEDGLCETAFRVFALPVYACLGLHTEPTSRSSTATRASSPESAPWEQKCTESLAEIAPSIRTPFTTLVERVLELYGTGQTDAAAPPASREVGFFVALASLALELEVNSLGRLAKERSSFSADGIGHAAFRRRVAQWLRCVQAMHLLGLRWRESVYAAGEEHQLRWLCGYTLLLSHTTPARAEKFEALQDAVHACMSSEAAEPSARRIEETCIRLQLHGRHSGYLSMLRSLAELPAEKLESVNAMGAELLRLRKLRPFSKDLELLTERETEALFEEVRDLLLPVVGQLRELGGERIVACRERRRSKPAIIDVDALGAGDTAPSPAATERKVFSVLIFYGVSLLVKVLRNRFPDRAAGAAVAQRHQQLLEVVWPVVHEVRTLVERQSKLQEELGLVDGAAFWDARDFGSMEAAAEHLLPEGI